MAKYTHVWRWGTHRTSVWHLLINLFKKLFNWANRKAIITIFTLFYIFLKKNKEKHLEISLFYTCVLGNYSVIFCPPLPHTLTTRKTEFTKNEKQLLEISSFYTCVLKTTIIWGTVPEIRSETDNFYHFGPFFALLPPNNLQNQNFEK